MRDAIADAFKLVDGLDKAAFLANDTLSWACQNRVLAVAEAAKDLPGSLTARHPEIAWSDLIRMGDFLRHEYFRVENDVVWDTVTRDFVPLLAAVEKLLLAEEVDVFTVAHYFSNHEPRCRVDSMRPKVRLAAPG